MAPRDTLACFDTFSVVVLWKPYSEKQYSVASNICSRVFSLLVCCQDFPAEGLGLAGGEEIIGSFITEVAGLQKLRGCTSLHRKAILPTIARALSFQDYDR